MSTTSAAIAAYQTRYATAPGLESAAPGAVKVALAELALQELKPMGLQDAYPRGTAGMPRAFAGDPPFFFLRPFLDTPAQFQQVTLGGHAAFGAVPGGQVDLLLPVEACVAVGASQGDPALLTAAADEWLFNLAWFFSLNRQLGGLVPEGLGLEQSAPLYGDIRWGGDWYCVRWPLLLTCSYLMPAAG